MRPPSHRFATAPHKVRIIGGAFKRTPIPVPDHAGLRPTPDRVRETVFNWLGFLRPDFARLRGLDLFAGTGALGFELASRGARSVVLVERDTRLAANLRALRDRLGATQMQIVVADALAFAAQQAAASFDVIFLDPPFDSGLLAPSLKAVRRLLAKGGLLYVESGAALNEQDCARLELRQIRTGRAGMVHFGLLAAADDADDHAAAGAHLPLPSGS
jgi:16S rRNA (guanine(966)-N(2))-methyltransferase RsmD